MATRPTPTASTTQVWVRHQLSHQGISQSGSPGSYSYSVTGSNPQAANCPVFDVTWGDAARFCNWLQNGQPTSGTEAAGTTETGAYTLNGDMITRHGMHATRAATYFIPSENEWYKAAYYKGGGTNAGYWTYPTQSNTAPGNSLALAPSDQQRGQLLQRQRHRSDKLSHARGHFCGISRPLWDL